MLGASSARALSSTARPPGSRDSRATGLHHAGLFVAALAHCPEKEPILARRRKSEKPVDRLAHEPKRLEKLMAETRERGYAVRDPPLIGGFYGMAPLDDGLAAIALPLADLQGAAQEIVASLHAAGRGGSRR
jgi:DNA-binding IclR family transcriptional regulator